MPETLVRDALRTAPGERRVERAGARLYDDLMALDPEVRREFYRGLNQREMQAMLAAAKREGGTPMALWRDDALGFVEDVLGEETWSISRQILRALPTHEKIAVPSCFSSSKCVPYGETMQLADGSLVRAGDLVERQQFHVLGWRPDGQQIVRRARAAWNQIEPVYRVTSASGRTIVRNGPHPLWVAHYDRQAKARKVDGGWTTQSTLDPLGWTPVSDLDPDRHVLLVPDIVHTVGDGWMPTEQAALLGYLLGDGGTTTNISFTQLPGPALDEFLACVEKLGARATERSRPGARAVTVEVAADGRNAVRDLARRWGILGCKATEKRVPAEVWRMDAATIATVAGRLFSCDGYVHIRTEKTLCGERVPLNEAYLGITLVNEGLVRDFQRMMLRLGISGTVRPVRGEWNGKPVEAWQWTVTTAAEIKRFADVIDAPAKNEQVARAAEVAAGRKYVKDWRFREAPEGYHWEKIASIEELPPTMTVQVEVEEDHAWVDHFVEHNSWTLSRATLWFSNVHPVGTARVVTLAPLWRQVSGIMWGNEIRGAHARAGLPGEVGAITYKIKDTQGVFRLVAEGIVGNPRNEATTQGIHSPNVLVLVDEAGGIPHGVGRNLRALLTAEGTQMVAIGNPPADNEGTWFEDLCSRDDVLTIPISAFDTPNFTGEKAPRCRSCPPEAPRHTLAKHLAKRAFVEEVAREFGEDSPYYKAKVLAQFPRGGSLRIIPSQWVEDAVNADEPEGDEYVRLCDLGLSDETAQWKVKKGAWVRLGVDIASDGGDEFVISRVVGDLVTVEHVSTGSSNTDAVTVAMVIQDHIRKAQRLRAALGTRAPVRVKIDAIGLGWGPVSTLKAWGSEGLHDGQIIGVNVAENTGREDQSGSVMNPYRKRDEMWIATRQLLQPRVNEGLPGMLRLRVDRRTQAQLTMPSYKSTSSAQVKVESKGEVKKRMNIETSPDRAEAVLLALYEPLVKEGAAAPRLIV